jgi:peptide/nickel transport system permease protein
VAVAVPLGVASAVWKDRWPDQVARTLAVAGISTPSFWFGMMLIYVFYGRLSLAPPGGRIATDFQDFVPQTGFYLIDSLAAGRLDVFADALAHLALPAITLAVVALGGMARLVRASMLEALSEDYIRTARASGLSPFKVIALYALPNALIPFVTSLALYFAHLLSGAVVTEIVFAWPGVGSYMMESALALDFPAIMGFTLVVSFVYILANLAADLAYLVLDPQIREAG